MGVTPGSVRDFRKLWMSHCASAQTVIFSKAAKFLGKEVGETPQISKWDFEKQRFSKKAANFGGKRELN